MKCEGYGRENMVLIESGAIDVHRNGPGFLAGIIIISRVWRGD